MKSPVTVMGRSGASGTTACRQLANRSNCTRCAGSCDIGLALDRVYRIIFATEREGRALDASKIGKHIERVAFVARFCEPTQHFWPDDRAACHVRIARGPRIERKRPAA